MNRITLFANTCDVATKILVPRFLYEIDSRNDTKVAALYLAGDGPGKMLFWSFVKNLIIRTIQVILGSGRMEKSLLIPPLWRFKGYDFPVYQLPDNDPNHPDIIAKLQNRSKTDMAINIYCRRLFKRQILDRFKLIANYHNGYLPEYRGLRASNWSIYMGEPFSGYSFHLMENKFDTGNILSSGEVPIKVDETPADLEMRKAKDACERIPDVLTAMVEGRSTKPQTSMGCEHNYQSYKTMVQVPTPSSLSKCEWEKRLKAFLKINTCLHQKWVTVTGISPCKGPGKLTFCSKDGYWLKVTSINFWPAWMTTFFMRG